MLTKSDFKTYLDAPMHLWAKKHDQYFKEINEFQVLIANQGYEVEKYAKEYVSQFISKDFITQKEFKTEKLLAKADIVVGKDIYEVKSTTRVKKEIEYDILFQYYTAIQTEQVEHIYLIYLNKDYKREGDIDIEQLFIVKDMTYFAKEHIQEIEEMIADALNIQAKESSLGLEVCYKPKECPCNHLCHPNLKEYSIYDISNIVALKIDQLKANNIHMIVDIPEYFKLSKRQHNQIKATKEKKPIVKKDKIKEYINNLQYPLYFLDYETYSWAIPKYENYKVYQDVVFQFSLHILQKDGTLSHHEYIHTEKSDPTCDLVTKLKESLPEDNGSILVWNKSFEKGCNKDMASVCPQFSDFLYGLNERIVDLGDIFNKQMYIDYRFKGSWSIKNVLPVLIPKLSYKNLEISNGTQAMSEWESYVHKGVGDPKVIDNLLEYCKLDTNAMIEIYNFLLSII
jgi:hypothetical protein